jgi:hypothetical protein
VHSAGPIARWGITIEFSHAASAIGRSTGTQILNDARLPSDLSALRSPSQNGGATSSAFSHIDGNFAGTTDEIIQSGLAIRASTRIGCAP